jgi:hypothetical protein
VSDESACCGGAAHIALPEASAAMQTIAVNSFPNMQAVILDRPCVRASVAAFGMQKQRGKMSGSGLAYKVNS